MSYLLDPPALFLTGIVLLLLQKFFKMKYQTVAAIGAFIAFVFFMGGSTLLYLDVIRWPFPDMQGSVWMFHTNYTGIRKEDVPVPLVAAMVLIYPLWLYLGYVVAERLAKRRIDRVLQQSPSHTVSGEKLAVGSIRLNMSLRFVTRLSRAGTIMEASEQVILARIRTLLALGRNYLAEERTALAEFRTGLAIAVVAPSASAVVAYIFALIPSETGFDFSLLVFTFLGIVTIIGVLTGIRSQSRLKKIRKQKKKLRDHEDAIIKSSKAAHHLLGDLIDLDDKQKTSLSIERA